jgi:hypothetical protein
MNRYLVEAHATFRQPANERLDAVKEHLGENDEVLADPPPQLLTSDAEDHAVVQFAIEAVNEAKADAKGRQVANAVLQTDDAGEPWAEIGLVSARDLDIDSEP